MAPKEKPLDLAIYVEHGADAPVEQWRAEIEGLLPDARFSEFVAHDGVRILAYEIDDRPEEKQLEAINELAWVEWSDGTAWTGPIEPKSTGGECPFAAIAASMSPEEIEAFKAEHMRELAKQA